MHFCLMTCDTNHSGRFKAADPPIFETKLSLASSSLKHWYYHPRPFDSNHLTEYSITFPRTDLSSWSNILVTSWEKNGRHFSIPHRQTDLCILTTTFLSWTNGGSTKYIAQ